jgi:long-chain acyl-CoA synthetase
VLEDALEVLPRAEIIQVYGSHEAGSISYLDGAGHRDAALRRSAGRPLLATEVRVRQQSPSDPVGEIEVKTPWMPHARLSEKGREPETSEWSRTGDLGELKDGFIFLRDRMNDVIISGGFNVYPLEVEAVIDSHPDILSSAVVSAPDDRWGERVIAFVVPREGRRLDDAALRAYCKARLANYKVPKEVRAIAQIPTNPGGKPDRRRLSEPMWKGEQRRIN